MLVVAIFHDKKSKKDPKFFIAPGWVGLAGIGYYWAVNWGWVEDYTGGEFLSVEFSFAIGFFLFELLKLVIKPMKEWEQAEKPKSAKQVKKKI